MTKLIFLPGASGRKAAWEKWTQSFSERYSIAVVGWPGLDSEPDDPEINHIADLRRVVANLVEDSTVLFAQSMGGVVALHTYLEHQESIVALVLCVTSGGLNKEEFDCENWRPDFLSDNPEAPRWFVDCEDDLTHLWTQVKVPVLLLWGSLDRISPVAMGKKLNNLITDSELVVVDNADHDLIETHAANLLPIVREFLKKVDSLPSVQDV